MRTLLTARAAADRLGVSYATLKQWIYKGSIRTSRTRGGHHRIAESEIERLLAAAPSSPRRSERRARPSFPGPIVALSGRNQLRGIVEDVRFEGLLGVVHLRVGDQRLTAVITRDAVDDLRLRRGEPALAVVKATEVMIAREAQPDLPPVPRKRPSRRR
jgi:molybdopterin-binding protein